MEWKEKFFALHMRKDIHVDFIFQVGMRKILDSRARIEIWGNAENRESGRGGGGGDGDAVHPPNRFGCRNQAPGAARFNGPGPTGR